MSDSLLPAANWGRGYLFIDVLQRPIGMLAIANTVASYTSLAGIFFAFNQHPGFRVGVGEVIEEVIEVAPDDRKRPTRSTRRKETRSR